MGLFDSVWVNCPSCGKPVEFQSDEWNCCLDDYTTENAPAPILCDIVNEPAYCMHCGNWMALVDPDFPPNQPLPAPKLRAVRVKTPADAEIHTTQSFLRWWSKDRPFTYDDLVDGPPTKNSETKINRLKRYRGIAVVFGCLGFLCMGDHYMEQFLIGVATGVLLCLFVLPRRWFE